MDIIIVSRLVHVSSMQVRSDFVRELHLSCSTALDDLTSMGVGGFEYWPACGIGFGQC